MWNRLNKLKVWQWTAIFVLSIAIFYFAIPPANPLFDDDFSTVVKADDGSLLNAFINSNEQWHFPPDTSEIPEKLKIAVITFEDESFYSHIGVNFRAIFRAAYQNIRSKKIVSGASTIPMQLARMKKQNKRTYFNKFVEICYAVKLSLYNGKDDLLKLIRIRTV